MNVYIEEKLAMERQRAIRATCRAYAHTAARRRSSARAVLLASGILLFAALVLVAPVGAHQPDGALLNGSARNGSGGAVALYGVSDRIATGPDPGYALPLVVR